MTGDHWSDQQDPEKRIADLEHQQAEPGAQPIWGVGEWSASPDELTAASKTRRHRWPVGVWMRIILLAALALVILYMGADMSYQSLSGTPTTATVTYCAVPDLHDSRSRVNPCKATWSIGGQSQTGPIITGTNRYPVGSRLDVRVRGGVARMPALKYFAVPGVLLVIWIYIFVGTRRRIRQ